MMEKTNYKPAVIFFITVFIFSLFVFEIFAAGVGLKNIEKLEKMEERIPLEPIVRPKVEYNAEGLRDPFQTPFIEEEAAALREPVVSEGSMTGPVLPPLTVQGIIWGGKFPQAIINNKVVKAGDTTIDGVRVISIDKVGITLFFGGKEYNLPSPAAGVSPDKKPQGGQDEKTF